MNRRQYLPLAATGLVLGVAGCTGADEQQYPPYPDSESTEFSGEGDTVTDSFDIQHDGPAVLDVAHMGDGDFQVSIVDDEEQPIQRGFFPLVTGPYNGFSIHQTSVDTYRLKITASGEWTATVYDLPAYEDGTGLSLPLSREGAFGDVIGPINFPGESVEYDVRFENTTGINRVLLINREGESVGPLFDNQRMDPETESGIDEDGTNQTLETGGVGYVSIESTTEWTASITVDD